MDGSESAGSNPNESSRRASVMRFGSQLYQNPKNSGKIFRQHNVGYMRIGVRTSWLRDVTLRKTKAGPTPVWSYLPVYMETSTGYADPKITINLDI